MKSPLVFCSMMAGLNLNNRLAGARAARGVSITGQDMRQIERANAIHRQPVIFIPDLRQPSGSWDHWAGIFEAAGYAALTPGWCEDIQELPGAHLDAWEIADHFAGIAARLDRRPAVVGYYLGGFVAQALAARGLSVATVAVDSPRFDKANDKRASAAIAPGILWLRSAATNCGGAWREVAATALEFVRRHTRRLQDVDVKRFRDGFMGHGAEEDAATITAMRRGSCLTHQRNEFSQAAQFA
jgi:hypothetical protein